MSYESGLLIRRQQREYPQELRQEIALTAIEIGNNREVARLYSNKLGYTVNESTVRGIKKRYIEGVQKGKISAPAGLITPTGGLSPRSSTGLKDCSLSPRGSTVKEDDSNQGNSSRGEEEELDEERVEEEEEEEEEELRQLLQPQSVMKLHLEVLEGQMKEETLAPVSSEDRMLIENEDDSSRDGNPLSIDIGESDPPEETVTITSPTIPTITNKQPVTISRPIIRINKDLQTEANNSLADRKRKAAAETNGAAGLGGPPFRKMRPSNAENETDIITLEKEIRALHWLARRKEQEWDQVVRLMKQKEEKLLQAQRTRTLINVESQHLLSRNSNAQSIVIPQSQIILLPKKPQPQQQLQQLQPNTKQIQSRPNIVTLAAPEMTEQRFTNLMQKATENLEKARSTPTNTTTNPTTTTTTTTLLNNSTSAAPTGGKDTTSTVAVVTVADPGAQPPAANGRTPFCQGCQTKKSEFVCAGCSNRWYCSRECQVEDWDEHADDCSG